MRSGVSPTKELQDIFTQLAAGRDLSRAVARGIFARVMGGELSESVIGALLGAFLVKGESVGELVGAAEAMRAVMVRVPCAADCIDTCGTGGDGVSTFNVSTTAAIIASAAGAVVAKHGNRSATRVSGSSEVMGALGIDVDAAPEVAERCLREIGIGYLNAQQLHPAMKHAAPVRRALPVRTLFNLLGPLTNPAGARRQLLGVPREGLMDLMAEALKELGAAHVWVVHGADGLCDLSMTGPSKVVELRNGVFQRFTVAPEQVGLGRATLDALLVKSPAQSAAVVEGILAGAPGPCRDHALLNSGAALVVAGIVEDLPTGVARAAEAIDSGAAREKLHRWRELAGGRG